MKRVLMSVLLAGLLGGCSHAMRITNLHEYRPAPTPPLEKQRTVALTSAALGDPARRGYIDAVAEGLRRDGSFSRVIYPWDGQAATDVVVDLQVAPAYAGKPSNFLVNWPGFLIFAPAIWGYGYQANIDTRATIRHADGGSQQVAIPTSWQFRQAEQDRTWTEVGWFEVGIIPLIGGLVFTGYDVDVTPEFVAKVSPDYGAYVAQRIREAIAAMRGSTEPATAPVVVPPGGPES